ncbi:MAG: Mur ligase family protein, partial [Bacteroidota bacterium]
MYQRQGNKAFKKTLKNIEAFMSYLDNPHHQFKSIHIAGTNGKGTTAHLLSAILQSNGLKVGLYTSPHYKDFRERIKLNGALAPKKFITQFVKKHRAFIKQQEPSFFEITVAMAFEYFKEEKVDIAVIETGLGGRLDSTNVIKPLLSVITNISFDHEAMLGNTLPKIAKEKAGVIKRSTPVVIGEYQREVAYVFKSKAQQLKAPIYFASKSIYVRQTKTDLAYSYFRIKYRGGKEQSLKLNAHGSFQSKNVATALKAIEVLNDSKAFKITKAAIVKGAKELKSLTNYQGRWQILDKEPLIIADSGHNEEGIKTNINLILKEHVDQIHFVLGFVN